MESSAQDLGLITSVTPPEPAPTQDLEAALGHQFTHKHLLAQALTHSSLAHERTADDPRRDDNERLEFLGDAVVGLLTTESLYRRYPELSEGSLTRLRGALVSRKYLAQVARSLNLGQYLLLGRGEERSGGRAKAALLANAMEAVLGAIYLDAGLETTRRIVESHVVEPAVAALRAQLQAGSGVGDFKSALQELLQARHQGQPEYSITAESGPDHLKQFFVEVRAADRVLAEGTGRTRKLAEQDAARLALDRLQSDEGPA